MQKASWRQRTSRSNLPVHWITHYHEVLAEKLPRSNKSAATSRCGLLLERTCASCFDPAPISLLEMSPTIMTPDILHDHAPSGINWLTLIKVLDRFELFEIFPAVVFETCQHSKFPHERLLVSWQVTLVLVLLPFRHQTGWLYSGISSRIDETFRVKWVPVTTAWRVLRLRMEERPPI